MDAAPSASVCGQEQGIDGEGGPPLSASPVEVATDAFGDSRGSLGCPPPTRIPHLHHPPDHTRVVDLLLPRRVGGIVALLEGSLPPRALSMVLEWAALHQLELKQNWRRARERRPLGPIDPLDSAKWKPLHRYA